MGDNWLITGRRQPSLSALLELIVESMIDEIRTVVVELTEEIDRIEDHVLEKKFSNEEMVLGKLRRKSVRLHRDLLGYHVIFRRFS